MFAQSQTVSSQMVYKINESDGYERGIHVYNPTKIWEKNQGIYNRSKLSICGYDRSTFLLYSHMCTEPHSHFINWIFG